MAEATNGLRQGRAALLAGDPAGARQHFLADGSALGRVWAAFAAGLAAPAAVAEADAALGTALATADPDVRRTAAWLRGVLAGEQGRPGPAAAWLELAADGPGAPPALHLALARARLGLGQVAEAAEAARAARGGEALVAQLAGVLVAVAEGRPAPGVTGNRYGELAALEAACLAGQRDGLARARELAHELGEAAVLARLEALAPLPADETARLAEALAAVGEALDADALLHAAIDGLVALVGASAGLAVRYDNFEPVAELAVGGADARLGEAAFQVLWAGETLAADGLVGLPVGTAAVLLAAVDEPPSARALGLAEALARAAAAGLGRFEAIAPWRSAHAAEAVLRPLVGELLAGAGLPAIARAALAATGAARALVLGADLACLAALNADPAEPSFSRGLAGEVLARDRPLHLVDAADEALVAAQDSVRELALRTVLAVPLRAAGEVVGVLYLDAPRVLVLPEDPLPLLLRLGELAGALVRGRAIGG